MDGGNPHAPPPPLPKLTAVAAAQFREGIDLILSRWTALQMAVQNEWGGVHSSQKPQQLAVYLLSVLTQSRERVYIDDVEGAIDEFFMDSLNTVIEDGSVEEVALKLMEMHEECVQGNFDSVRILREANPPSGVAASRPSIRQANNEDDDDNESSGDDDSSQMIVDPPQSQPNYYREDRMADKPFMAKVPAQTEDGWTVVGSKRNKAKNN